MRKQTKQKFMQLLAVSVLTVFLCGDVSYAAQSQKPQSQAHIAQGSWKSRDRKSVV